jgi:hypothetical protein
MSYEEENVYYSGFLDGDANTTCGDAIKVRRCRSLYIILEEPGFFERNGR